MDREEAEKLVGDFGEAVINRKTGIEPFMDVVMARNALIEALTAQPPPPETKGEAIDKIGIARIAGEIAGIAEGTAFIFKNDEDDKEYIGKAVESLMTIRRLAMSLYSAQTLRNPLIGGESPKAKECPGIVSKDLAGWTCTYDKNGVCLTCGGQRGYESK